MQRTREFETFQGRRKGYLAQDGVTIHVLHPDDPKNILVIPHPSVAAASATFAKIAKEYFGIPRGFKQVTDSAEFTGTDGWIPKPLTPEEEERLAGVAKRRMSGYDFKDGRLVISVKRMHRTEDLDIVFERAQNIKAIHAVLSGDDHEGAGRKALIVRIAKFAPQITELGFEALTNREGTAQYAVESAELLTVLLNLEKFTAVGEVKWPRALPPDLAEVSVFDFDLSPTVLQYLIAHPAMRRLSIRTKFTAAHLKLLASTSLDKLDELTLEDLPNVASAIAAISKAPSRPGKVRLRGVEPSDPQVVEAAVAENIEVDSYPSPFDPQSRPAELRALWEGLD